MYGRRQGQISRVKTGVATLTATWRWRESAAEWAQLMQQELELD